MTHATRDSLLELPDPCLLRVLLCCAADDQRSVCSAARAHSRLHQAALLALSSISAVSANQQQVDSVLQYLDRLGQHVDSINIRGKRGPPPPFGPGMPTLWQLPTSLKLSSMQLASLHLQLQPGGGFQGVLGAAAPASLKKLSLKNCTVIDHTGCDNLTAFLQELRTVLDHLSLVEVAEYVSARPLGNSAWLSSPVLQQLQQLTYLELGGDILQRSSNRGAHAALQPLQALTRLADLRLAKLTCGSADLAAPVGNSKFTVIDASMLSSTLNLTRLELCWCVLEPSVLAGKTQMQHLALRACRYFCPTRSAHAEVQLMSNLQPLQQLTHLYFEDSLGTFGASDCSFCRPAAAYAALTASSKLQHLSISRCGLPAGAWQHMFPAGKQLPHLQTMVISEIVEGFTRLVFAGVPLRTPAPAGSSLVSCCPCLQHLDMQHLHHSADLLSSLTGLSSLHTLLLQPAYGSVGSLLDVCQLTGLRKLGMTVCDMAPCPEGEGLLLQLTQLQGLTQLDYYGPSSVFAGTGVKLVQGPGDVPVWCQILQHHQLQSAMLCRWHMAQQSAGVLSD